MTAGVRCSCKRGVQRDNCPTCEGTGWAIDFQAIHAARRQRQDVGACPARPIVYGVPRKCNVCGIYVRMIGDTPIAHATLPAVPHVPDTE